MQQSGTLSQDDRNAYFDAWAKMMITIWQDKIAVLKVRDTGKLFSSFKYTLEKNANGDINKIIHTYNYYGRMVDMGVGRGVTKENAGRGSGREAKPWYNKAFYASAMRAVEFSMEWGGKMFIYQINDAFNITQGKARDFGGASEAFDTPF